MTVMEIFGKANDFRPAEENTTENERSVYGKANDFRPAEENTTENERSVYGKLKVCKEVESDLESIGSSEDSDSPRSVSKVRRCGNAVNLVHSRILRIREEDLQIGDAIGEGLKNLERGRRHHHHVQFVVFRSKPVLPASPLGVNTKIAH